MLCVTLPGEGEICGGRHGHSPLMRTCSALPHWSVPETTMRSPSSRPDTISTLLTLLAPAWIGRRVALPPSTTPAQLPPPCPPPGPPSHTHPILPGSNPKRQHPHPEHTT